MALGVVRIMVEQCLVGRSLLRIVVMRNNERETSATINTVAGSILDTAE